MGRKKHIRRFVRSRGTMYARSDIGEIVVNGNKYQEVHIVCYSDCSGMVSLRSNIEPYLSRPEPLTGSFHPRYSVLGHGDNREVVEEMVKTFTRGEIPLTHRAGCHFSPPQKIDFKPGRHDVMI